MNLSFYDDSSDFEEQPDRDCRGGTSNFSLQDDSDFEEHPGHIVEGDRPRVVLEEK